MNTACGTNDNGDFVNRIPYPSNQTTNITNCDTSRLMGIYICPTPTPTPSGGGSGPTECPDPPPTYPCDAPIPATNCPYYVDEQPCTTSPILVDIAGNGFSLTSADNRVLFDITSDGHKEKLAWTTISSDDAWLALDRNNNGTIENGAELFGNFTPQPASNNKNGFLALAEYDKSENGGNDDGKLTSQDSIFNSLRLWQDTNHNGISEPDELHALLELGISKLELNYHETKRTDEFGNQFKYRAKVWDVHGAQAGRWAWDVFLKSAQ